MAVINTKFIALPKKYVYPEDLEDGIYYDDDNIIVIYDASKAIFRVLEKTESIEEYDNYKVRRFEEKEREFSLKDWIVIYNGCLYDDRAT